MIDNSQDNEDFLKTLKLLCEKNRGHLGLILHLKAENGFIQRIRAKNIGVNVSINFVQCLRNLLGEKHIWIS